MKEGDGYQMNSTAIGTPLSLNSTKVMMLGSGELGKEVVIELQRLGVEVIAVDRYPNAPAMQVAHRSHVINMLDGAELRSVIEKEKPTLIVPEIEAIATPTLVEFVFLIAKSPVANARLIPFSIVVDFTILYIFV